MICCGCGVQGTFGMRTGNAVLHSIRNLSLSALCWTTPERDEKQSASSMSSTLAVSQARTKRNKSFWSHDRGTASTCWPQHRVSAPRGRLRGGGQPFWWRSSQEMRGWWTGWKSWMCLWSIRANRREQSETERLNGVWTRTASRVESSVRSVPLRSRRSWK